MIIFDCDGVLIDSERIFNRVFAECLNDIGVEITFEEAVKKFKGRSTKDCEQILTDMLGYTPTEEFYDSYKNKAISDYHLNIKAIPGIETALSQIKIKTCIASNSAHQHILTGLEKTNLLSHFEGRIFSSYDVARPKPYPDLYLHAAEKMQVSPDNCLVVEDSVPGITAAVAAGMKVLGYSDLTHEDLLKHAGAITTFKDMRELPQLINRYLQ